MSSNEPCVESSFQEEVEEFYRTCDFDEVEWESSGAHTSQITLEYVNIRFNMYLVKFDNINRKILRVTPLNYNDDIAQIIVLEYEYTPEMIQENYNECNIFISRVNTKRNELYNDFENLENVTFSSLVSLLYV